MVRVVTVIFIISFVKFVLLIGVTTSNFINTAERDVLKTTFMSELGSAMELDTKLQHSNILISETISVLCNEGENKCQNMTEIFLNQIQLIQNYYLIVRTFKDDEMMRKWCEMLYNKGILIELSNTLKQLQPMMLECIAKKFEKDVIKLGSKNLRGYFSCNEYKKMKDEEFQPFFLNLILIEMKLMTTMVYSAWEIAPTLIDASHATADALTYGWHDQVERIIIYANYSLNNLVNVVPQGLRSCDKTLLEPSNTKLIRNLFEQHKRDWMSSTKGKDLMHAIVKSQILPTTTTPKPTPALSNTSGHQFDTVQMGI